MQLTFTLHYRIHDFLLKESTEGVSESRLSIEYDRRESSNENIDHFINIWKMAANYAHIFVRKTLELVLIQEGFPIMV